MASLAALVMQTSIWRQRRMRPRMWFRLIIASSGCFVTDVNNTMTCLQRFVFNWSVMDVSRCMRRRQYSSSVAGPESVVSHRERSVSPR